MDLRPELFTHLKRDYWIVASHKCKNFPPNKKQFLQSTVKNPNFAEMEGPERIPTVFDIAREAGVSRGTVDRVLHNRGRFSPETAGKVREAVERLGYSANPNASLLASRKALTLACLLPSYREGEYWQLIHRGIEEGIRTWEGCSLKAEMYFYDQTDVASFREQYNAILRGDRPSAVLMNAVFKDEVRTLSSLLEQAGIPYAFIDNKVDGLGNFLYVGIDPYRSGQLGAFLLTVSGAPEEIGLVRILRDKGHQGDPNEPRRQGFADYIAEHFPQCAIRTVFIDPERPESILPALEEFRRAHPAIRHYATTNSRVHLIAPFLSHHPEMTAVGFDDLEKNLRALREGSVDFLVTHGILRQAALTVELIARYLVSGTLTGPRNRYVHLDILHRLNLDDFPPEG